MLSSVEIAQFKKDGFLLGGKALSDETVDLLNEEVARVIRDRDSGGRQPVLCHNFAKDKGQTVWQIVNIWEASDAFHDIIANPGITGEVAQLTDADELRIWHDQIQYKTATDGGVNMWHQDSPYWPILTPKTSQVTAWIALDDVDEENGCMSMVEGSYHWGPNIDFLHTLKSWNDMPAQFDGHPLVVRTCPAPKGHVHFHHALTWHGSHANTSARPRRAIALHYMTQETRYNAAGNHVMKQFVTCDDGEVLTGEHFPLVWKR